MVRFFKPVILYFSQLAAVNSLISCPNFDCQDLKIMTGGCTIDGFVGENAQICNSMKSLRWVNDGLFASPT